MDPDVAIEAATDQRHQVGWTPGMGADQNATFSLFIFLLSRQTRAQATETHTQRHGTGIGRNAMPNAIRMHDDGHNARMETHGEKEPTLKKFCIYEVRPDPLKVDKVLHMYQIELSEFDHRKRDGQP